MNTRRRVLAARSRGVATLRKAGIAVLAWLAAAPAARAQEGAVAAPVRPEPAAPAEATASVPLESLRQQIRQTEAQQAAEIQALKDEIARRDQEAAVEHEREALERERLLRIYGFADFGILRAFPPEEPFLASQFNTPLSFYFGRLNLYYDAKPSEDFRFLVETRLSLYPNGTSAGADASTGGVVRRTSTAVSDVSSPNPTATVNWGSIILERATLDFTRYPLLSVRAGLFLTPFGIYNVDHGSPTLINATLPGYLSQKWIPVQQLGVQVFGSYPLAPWEIGWIATLGNSRSDGILDRGDAKAYGGRVFARRQGELSLTVGGSALYQLDRQNREQFGPAPDGGITYSNTRVVEGTLFTVGGDLALDFRGFRLRSEVVMYQVRYAEGKRALAADDLRGGYAPDMRNLNFYLIAAYRVWRLEPYFLSDVTALSPARALLDKAWGLVAGVNLYLRPNVIFKPAILHAMFFKKDDTGPLPASAQNFDEFVATLVWAF
ncbi:MAG: hypothetical protein JXP73_05330 [Deltaproteobacteria bacterium]|nr:hypothetical protein [Deltaproteobacteria bacterium]